MSRYRQTMSEALNQVRVFEDADYLKPKLNPQQIANIKKVFSKKKASDITQSVKDMIKKMDIPTQLAIKQADIPHLSKLVEEEYLPEFNDAMIKTLKKEYEPMRGKTISVTNANKLGALFTRFDSNKNALEKLYGADIPFISTMAMTRLMTKHGYKADKLNKIRKEELDLLEEAELLGEGTGTIKGFRDNKEKSNMVSLAKQHGLKVKDVSGGIELSGNMRKILDMQLAAQGNGLKAEEVAEGRMSDIDAMRKAGATAAEIAKELKLPVRTVKDILGEEVEDEKEEPKKEEDTEKLKAEIQRKDDEIAMLKQKAETEKAKTQKKETEKLVNPETGEPLLQVGIAYKHLKDKMKKEDVDLKEFKKMKVTIADMDKRKKAIADLIKQNLGVSVTGGVIKVDGKGRDLNNFAKDLMNFYGANVVAEADLSKSQIKKVHKMADELPKKDFKDRYGKEKGDAVRYATATNIVKKKLGIKESADTRELTNLYNKRTALTPAEKKRVAELEKKLGINESAAANEIQKNTGPRDGMDYNMYKKTVELLRKKDYKALGKHIYDAETAPREYVMGVIDKKEPQTFKKMFGNQSGYYSLMKPLKMSKEEVNMKEHPAKAVYEQIAGLKKKAEKSGMPYSILKKVYDRGMAAWRGGHRPGTTQQQWAFARVNSFVTKSSGTWGGADKDLAAKVRGSK